MQIILQEDVEKLGTRGQLVEVAEGYARNFLLPRKLALEASAGNMKRLEKMRAMFAKKEASEKGDATTLAGLLAGVSLEMSRKGWRQRSAFRLRHFRRHFRRACRQGLHCGQAQNHARRAHQGRWRV